ncbi:MAG TPA: TonB-dependent receptor, partial [Bryobacteraceae bacterium]
SGFRRTAESEITGDYSVGALEPGVYKITVRKEGFRTVIRFGVKVGLAVAARVDFTLPVGSMQESITVVGDAPLLDRADAATGGQFEAGEIERLPLNGRGILTLLELVPGTNVTPATRGEAGQFTSTGQRPNTNYFLIDGVSANIGVTAGGVPAQSNGGALPGLSAFGSMDSLISLDAVQEFRLQTSTSVAEFGRLPGAIVTLTSRAGTNQFHGSTSYRIRRDVLAANDWFGNRAGFDRGALRLDDASETFGGPIVRDRTFFFLSYQHIALRQPYVWMQPVPAIDVRHSAAAWVQPALNLFPEPNGPALAGGAAQWTGHTNRPASLVAGSARFDHAVTRRISVFGRYQDAPSENQFGTTQVNLLDLRSRSLTLAANIRPTASLVFDTRFNESEARAHSVWTNGYSKDPGCDLLPVTQYLIGVKASCDYLVRFSIGGIGQLVSGREGDRRQRQFQAIESASWTHGGHTFNLGADYRRMLAVRRDANPTLGIIADDLTMLASKSRLWLSNADAVRTSTQLEELSLWAQDSWRATGRLTLTLGLRWEYSPAPVPADSYYLLNRESGTFFSASGPLWPLSLHNFAPRTAAAYRLTRDGRTVLRAGAGLYYDSSLSIATDVINGGPLSVSQFESGRAGLVSSQLSYGFLPDLELPQIVQWNVTIEHAFGSHDVGTLGYVGSAGRNLVRREVGGPGSTERSLFALTTNHARSDYHALQMQYRRNVARGLNVAASYTWSHSIDDDSSDAFLTWADPRAVLAGDRGSSDFDLRHSFTGAVDYEFRSGWAVDGIFHARTGFPVNVLQSEQYLGIAFNNAFRPDLLGGVPVWIADPSAPGGRLLNPAAFAATKSGVQGTLGRNAIDGFGMSQFDLAVRRHFRWGDRLGLDLRVEAFNAFNHPNFADPVRFLNNPLYGQSASMLNLMLGTGSPGSGLAPILQTGGPRSLQLSARLRW